MVWKVWAFQTSKAMLRLLFKIGLERLIGFKTEGDQTVVCAPFASKPLSRLTTSLSIVVSMSDFGSF
jgi:hypothetical protein